MSADLSTTNTGELYGSIAHRLFCELGNCANDPQCFFGQPEAEQARWVDAVKKVLSATLTQQQGEQEAAGGIETRRVPR